MIKVEILFPEICNLYGDLQNIDYLKKSSDEIEIVEDNLIDEPYFLNNVPDLIYMGTLTEKSQNFAIEKLRPYRKRLMELIESGVHFLITGNALEIFGTEIIDDNLTKEEGLEIFPFMAKRNMMNRFNSLYLGDFDTDDLNNTKIKIVGYKSQFTQGYFLKNYNTNLSGDLGYMFDTERGTGLNPEIMEEGLRYKNFMGTYLLGPLLILNPPFTKWLLKKLGCENIALAFEEAALKAYNIRVAEYSEPDRGFTY